MRQWTVDIVIDEEEDERTTRAEARLRTHAGEQLSARGTAYRHPNDREVPQIGDELATARALSELSHRLVLEAAEDIEQVTHRPTHLEG
ncbi:uncharacterized protein DUF1876 [Kribbella pratensis]|uniref:Uncharacterized protein DUF1876 n=2 Tax=Kribbellaceae TaxID=2726069 RepID=A0ABY2FJV4_9ACTN|nr:uncharacterized protein DUF1876 [Kribbella sp. VKM Ac-2566]TDW92905.1 uncharacterized protein DUF1876 [Kribbella pratensis]